MSNFNYQNGQLFVEGIPLQQIAEQYGTPCYVYSKATLVQNWQQYATALKKSGVIHKIYYAIKANPNIGILNILAKQGAGFDAVSGGEIDRALAAGASAAQIVFSGVGKSSLEIMHAINLGISSINIESESELQRVYEIAKKLNQTVNIAFRINPDVVAGTHPYIATGSKNNKFGIEYNAALDIYKKAASLSNLKITGISCHIGSQITSLEPFLQALDQILKLVSHLTECGIKLQFIDLGGGLGIRYKDENPPAVAEYINAITEQFKHHNLELHLEPGRSIVADAGILLTRVEYLKSNANNNFAVVDAAMNDLLRPALYQSYHEIIQVLQTPANNLKSYSIVGPVCESGDFLAQDRKLDLQEGELLAILNCGAYGFSMSSNYNTRPRCAEILVDGKQSFVIRDRETFAELIHNERLID